MPTNLPARRHVTVKVDERRVAPGSEFLIWFTATWAVAMLLFGAIARWGLQAVDVDPFNFVGML